MIRYLRSHHQIDDGILYLTT